MKRSIGAVVVAGLAAGCGGAQVTGPSSPTVEPESGGAQVALAALPARMFGAFASSSDVPEAAAHAGSVVLVVPTYADDPEVVAAALRGAGKVAIVSAHHVFGNPRTTWGVEPSAQASAVRPGSQFSMRGVTASSVGGWQKTLAWMEPLRRAGVLAAVYVVDEPLHNGISKAIRDEAIAIVRAAGFPTVLAEGVDAQKRYPGRPPVDYYGVSCYDFPGPGGWTLDRCATAYRDNPGWNLVIGQGYDLQLQERNGPVPDQVATWAELGRLPGRSGTIFWVWDWPGQVGLALDPEALTAYDRAGGR